MRATFTRPAHGPDRVDARRADGSVTSWTCPSYGGSLPHDLVHVIVESVFELRSGLWGLVNSGLEPAAANQRVREGMRRSRAESFAEGQTELLEAEGLCLMHWYDPDLSGEARCEQITDACAELRVNPPATLTPERADRACGLARGLRRRWRASGSIGDRTVLSLDFSPEDPAGAIRALERLCCHDPSTTADGGS